MANSYDKIWNDIYGSGAAPQCPYDFIASFVFRNAPKDKPRSDVKILEVGCGAGNNLIFLARQGFHVSGIDGSEDAINYAKKQLSDIEELTDLRTGDFTDLPFEDNSFDLIFDRGALTCCGTASTHKAISEVRRCLKTGGAFFYNPIADSDTSFRSGTLGDDDLVTDIQEGDFSNVGQIRFVSRNEIPRFLSTDQWHYQRVDRVEITDMLNPYGKIVANWRVEVLKK